MGLGKSILAATSHLVSTRIAVAGAIRLAFCHAKDAPFFNGHFTIVSAAKHTLDRGL
jgi:hypothetical protein